MTIRLLRLFLLYDKMETEVFPFWSFPPLLVITTPTPYSLLRDKRYSSYLLMSTNQ